MACCYINRANDSRKSYCDDTRITYILGQFSTQMWLVKCTNSQLHLSRMRKKSMCKKSCNIAGRTHKLPRAGRRILHFVHISLVLPYRFRHPTVWRPRWCYSWLRPGALCEEMETCVELRWWQWWYKQCKLHLYFYRWLLSFVPLDSWFRAKNPHSLPTKFEYIGQAGNLI